MLQRQSEAPTEYNGSAKQDLRRVGYENKYQKTKIMRISSGKERAVNISIAGNEWRKLENFVT